MALFTLWTSVIRNSYVAHAILEQISLFLVNLSGCYESSLHGNYSSYHAAHNMIIITLLSMWLSDVI